MEEVILVDINDNQVGVMEKMQAHEEAKLHRAFSIIIFNDKGEMLLQQRAHHKYHSGGLWTNACCSHPRPGESVLAAAHRRLEEEMGMSTSLDEGFSFIYKATLDHGLTEYELDHVLFGYANQTPNINKDEVASYKWISMKDLHADVAQHANNYTVWFLDILKNSRFLDAVGEFA